MAGITGWTKKEMDLAHRIIETLADKWKPEDFRDTYTEGLPRRSRPKSKVRDSNYRRRRARGRSSTS
jgi:non-homologous end joining protein Ku